VGDLTPPGYAGSGCPAQYWSDAQVSSRGRMARTVPGDGRMSTEAGVAPYEVAPMIARSQAAFRRDLPELLKTHYWQWVAYHGDDRICFGRTQFELYEEYPCQT